ncbi:MAG: trypsin-like peptidase domain-containing protein [Clostridiales bacterium]|nr:trypsin-like peptidase domain-containing protein [Clostridiales bacterium]
MDEHKNEKFYLELTRPEPEKERKQIPALAMPQPEPLVFTPAYAPADRSGKRKGGGGFSRRGVVALMLCCLLFSSALGFGGGWLAASFNQTPAALSENGATALSPDESYAEYLAERLAARPEGSPLTIAQVAAIAADSVVEIVIQKEEQGFNFWGFSRETRIREGAGSGVIVAENGYIITNNHVIDKAIKIEVKLRNGQSYEAKLVATDPTTDVAVIKIEATGLVTAAMGDSSALVVGEPAVVIGNPLGQLGGTVTSGIISALDRAVSFEEDDGSAKTMNLLQTDASVNNGNSGGGLFNQYGELVGIVVAKSQGFSVEGLGFAIPINDVRGVIDDLIAYGYARGRIALGVTLITITDEQVAASYNLTSPGIYIFRVEQGSNAERAGLKSGDRLVKVNGQGISDDGQVREIIQKLSVGQTISVEYERNGVNYTVSIVMQETVPADVGATKTRY